MSEFRTIWYPRFPCSLSISISTMYTFSLACISQFFSSLICNILYPCIVKFMSSLPRSSSSWIRIEYFNILSVEGNVWLRSKKRSWWGSYPRLWRLYKPPNSATHILTGKLRKDRVINNPHDIASPHHNIMYLMEEQSFLLHQTASFVRTGRTNSQTSSVWGQCDGKSFSFLHDPCPNLIHALLTEKFFLRPREILHSRNVLHLFKYLFHVSGGVDVTVEGTQPLLEDNVVDDDSSWSI